MFEVFLAEQVVDGLHGVEGLDGYLGEDGDPVGHGTVPEAGQLLRLQGLCALAFLADEAGHGVDVFAQVEVAAVVVLGAADEVYGVEMCRRLEDGLLFGVVVVDLGRFDDLEAASAACVDGEERTAAGFAGVAHHAADADGTVE